MKLRIKIVGIATLGFLVAVVALAPVLMQQSPAHSSLAWGGKAEHCAMAIGVIGASILSLFANPLAGPGAVAAMSLGLIWMVATCD